MANIMKFYDAFEKGIIKDGDCINPIQCFPSCYNPITIDAKETGIDTNQTFIREDLKWFCTKDKNRHENINIFSVTTMSCLYLRGLNGAQNGLSIIQTILDRIYSNQTINFKARAINRQDITTNFPNLKNILSVCIKDRIWLNTLVDREDPLGIYSYSLDCLHSIYQGFKACYLYSQKNYRNILSVCYDDIKNMENTVGCQLGITIQLPSANIFVDLDSFKKSNTWEIFAKPLKTENKDITDYLDKFDKYYREFTSKIPEIKSLIANRKNEESNHAKHYSTHKIIDIAKTAADDILSNLENMILPPYSFFLEYNDDLEKGKSITFYEITASIIAEEVKNELLKRLPENFADGLEVIAHHNKRTETTYFKYHSEDFVEDYILITIILRF